ncbi:hypothetical protein BUALT_Bualt18G0126300 [Buddleja alternifolia]|uniref:Uncharacterized protein n=1 Tax=Buddleja alternifolia TaxID=168488 RepID=A0AAV6WAZ7_9LAMI|nr:hypothetical protein BUALT_Bualt18G0126300 [Buddleja alternifolia]
MENMGTIVPNSLPHTDITTTHPQAHNHPSSDTLTNPLPEPHVLPLATTPQLKPHTGSTLPSPLLISSSAGDLSHNLPHFPSTSNIINLPQNNLIPPGSPSLINPILINIPLHISTTPTRTNNSLPALRKINKGKRKLSHVKLKRKLLNLTEVPVEEYKARAIILLASREVEEKSNSPTGSDLYSPSPLYSPTSVLSMQRSLKRFLQKRKSRVQATYPYPPIVPTHSDED